MPKASFAAELHVFDGTALVKVAELLSVTAPERTRGTFETTAHDTTGGAKTFEGEALIDPGEISAQIHWVLGNTADVALAAWMAAGDVRAWRVVGKKASGTGQFNGSGILTSYAPDAMEIEGKQTATLTIKCSGPITQS